MEAINPVFQQGHQNEIILGPGNTNAMPLPVFIMDVDGHLGYISKWKLSEAERLKVLETGEIYLMVIGVHPPVRLFADLRLHKESSMVIDVMQSEDPLERLAKL